MNDLRKMFMIRMIEKNLNQVDIAKEINVSKNTINTWIKGSTPNNIKAYLKLLIILELQPTDIIDI